MDLNEKKKALRLLTYGLYICTSRAGSKIGAGTINWLSQASFHPPLVMAGIKVDSSLHEMIEASKVFAVHVVGKSQKKMATAFFKTVEVDGNKLNGYAFEEGETGAPLLVDAPAFFECRVLDRMDRGDHTVYVAEVVNAGLRREETPLTLREAGFNYGG